MLCARMLGCACRAPGLPKVPALDLLSDKLCRHDASFRRATPVQRVASSRAAQSLIAMLLLMAPPMPMPLPVRGTRRAMLAVVRPPSVFAHQEATPCSALA